MEWLDSWRERVLAPGPVRTLGAARPSSRPRSPLAAIPRERGAETARFQGIPRMNAGIGPRLRPSTCHAPSPDPPWWPPAPRRLGPPQGQDPLAGGAFRQSGISPRAAGNETTGCPRSTRLHPVAPIVRDHGAPPGGRPTEHRGRRCAPATSVPRAPPPRVAVRCRAVVSFLPRAAAFPAAGASEACFSWIALRCDPCGASLRPARRRASMGAPSFAMRRELGGRREFTPATSRTGPSRAELPPAMRECNIEA